MPAPKAKTEGEMLAMLRRRVEQSSGNGPTAVLVTHVRDAAGYAANRTLDAMSMGLWPSRGLVIDGYEVKCSRADWLRELKDPSKADGFCERVDRFWLVVADAAIVKPGELPDTWGMLAAKGGRLHEVTAAPLLRLPKASKSAGLPPGIERSFLAALLRSASKVGVIPDDVREEARAKAAAEAREWVADEVDRLRRDHAQMKGILDEFREASGVHLSEWSRNGDAAEIGAALKSLIDGDRRLENQRAYLERQAEHFRRVADEAQAAVAALAGGAGR
jgi:hypothetical protein